MSIAGATARAFTYDAAGNVIYDARSGVGYGYGYDAANRMDTLTIDGVVQAEYVYGRARPAGDPPAAAGGADHPFGP